MPFGYIGQNQTKQKVKNSGVLSSFDVSLLEKQGHAGGSLELISSETVTSMTSAVDFTEVFTDNYDVYYLEIKKMQSSVNAYSIGIQFYESGTLETASVYQYAMQGARTSPLYFESKSTSEAWITVGGDTDNDSGNSNNGYVYIYNPTNSSKYTFTTQHSTAQYDTTFNMRFGAGVLPQASTVNGFRLRLATTGNFTGEFLLYGVKQI
ncbi:MAG: hypothetical protein CBD62_00890 [Candidatus Pelagibacter sp. TMED202]|nr:MAG: hypothetical protein CBD62_00890 [Candidatus Pelagibacter sp. TMED202]|tara:strand:+ start:2170 stop:2793 length:624 start_codon:yes stop_codon:yes gene_type:complete